MVKRLYPNTPSLNGVSWHLVLAREHLSSKLLPHISPCRRKLSSRTNGHIAYNMVFERYTRTNSFDDLHLWNPQDRLHTMKYGIVTHRRDRVSTIRYVIGFNRTKCTQKLFLYFITIYIIQLHGGMPTVTNNKVRQVVITIITAQTRWWDQKIA